MIGRRVLAGLSTAALLAPPSLATWSIVVVHRITREVVVATATCVEGHDLDKAVPLVLVEKGAAAAQAFVASSAKNRKIIWKGFKNQKVPLRIMEEIIQSDSAIGVRQFGIVGFEGDPVTFTGADLSGSSFQWAGGLTGETEELIYAIQGNVLTGQAVATAAEQALLDTPGDLGQRVMAAMEAARAMGGDGRCSCDPAAPDSCGSPPPFFDKSAHQALIALARPGDKNGDCSGSSGCANGTYYLFLKEGGGQTDSDPVLRLQMAYDAWRAGLAGIPDHYLSLVAADAQSLVADGLSTAHVTVQLVDLEGVSIPHGGAKLTVKQVNEGPATARPGPVTDHGNGTYTFDLLATTNPGRGAWEVKLAGHGGPRPVLLQPPFIVLTDPLADLHVGVNVLRPGIDEQVPFTINRGTAEAGRMFRILGTFSGTNPGFDYMGAHVPLNRDRFLEFTWLTSGPPLFPGSAGVLDADGRAQARLLLGAEAWSSLVGERFHFVALLGGATTEVTSGVSFQVVP